MARHAIVATLTLLILIGGVSSEFHSVIKWGIAIFAFGIFGAWLHGSGDINDRIAVEQAVMKMFKMETIRVFNNRFKTREEVEEKYGPNVIYWIYEKDHDSCKLRIWNVSRKWFSEHAAFSAFIMIVSPSALTTAMYEIPEISLITFFGTYLGAIVMSIMASASVAVCMDQYKIWVRRFWHGEKVLNGETAPSKIVCMTDYTKLGKGRAHIIMERVISNNWSKCFVATEEFHKVHFNGIKCDIDLIATDGNEAPHNEMGPEMHRIKANDGGGKIVTLKKGVTLWMKMHRIPFDVALIIHAHDTTRILKIEPSGMIASGDDYLKSPVGRTAMIMGAVGDGWWSDHEWESSSKESIGPTEKLIPASQLTHEWTRVI